MITQNELSVVRERIVTLLQELAPIGVRLVEREGWDPERVQGAMDGYGKYLILLHAHPNTSLVPSEDIDQIWHDHILWTERYGGDCHDIFGRFIHHYPCFNMSDSDELQEQYDRRENTKQLFWEEFGVIPPSYDYGAGSGVAGIDHEVNKGKPKPPPCGGCNCYKT